MFAAEVRGVAVPVLAAISHVTVAAVRLRPTPTSMVRRSPSAGNSAKPASTAPSAAPIVLTAYNQPASAAARRAPRTIQREAIGKVAPIAAAGAASRNRLDANRRRGNVTLGLPSAYARASQGRTTASSSGSASASVAMAISMIA